MDLACHSIYLLTNTVSPVLESEGITTRMLPGTFSNLILTIEDRRQDTRCVIARDLHDVLVPDANMGCMRVNSYIINSDNPDE